MLRLLVFRVFLLFLLVVCLSHSESYATGVVMFNVAKGLSQSTVTSVIQDSKGFLWIATQDGLNRYDGYSFKPYRNNPLDTNSLSNNNINSICEDRYGNIWLGTNLGLSMLNRKTGRFINYFTKANDPKTISDNRIYCVYEDKEGTIWAKTSLSVDKLNSDRRTFTRFPHYNDLFTFSTDQSDFDILEDSQGVLWVGTKDGLCFLDRKLNIYKRFSHDPNNPKSISGDKVKCIYEEADGNIWIGTDNGLNLYNRNTGEFTSFFSKSSKSNKLQSSTINAVYKDSRGLVWIGTDIGFSSFNTVTHSITTYNDLTSNGEKLLKPSITSFVEDKSGILWIGTFQGLIKWDRKPSKFNLFSKNRDGIPLFDNNFIGSICQDKSGTLWIGTWGSGLFQFNPTTNEKVHFSALKEGRIVNDFVYSIFLNSNDELIIGTRDGVQIYLPTQKQFVDYFKYKNINSLGLFNNNRVYAFAEDRKGNLWIATRIGLLQVKSKELIGYYNNPNDTNSITSGEVYDVIVDKKGLVWAGSLNGLNRINPDTKRVDRFVRNPNFTGQQLISNDILSLLEDTDGNLWIGTSSGLHVFDVNTGKVKLYTEDNGLPNNIIYSLEEDNKGHIWMSTNWGLAMLNPKTESVKTYDVADGLQSQEFNVGSSFKSRSGKLYFGGISGFNSFYPDSIIANKNIPNIAITNFDLIGSKEKKTISVDGLTEIEIPQNFSVFTIDFASLDFTRPENNLYEYQMLGLSDQWIELGTKHSATFSNLSAGTYIFTVRGSNSDLTWNDKGVSLKILVNIPFWRTKMAFVIYIILGVLAGFLYLRNRTKHFRKTKKLLTEREFAMAEVEMQKEELIIKNKSITDSINYAKRLQEAIMPSAAQYHKLLPDSFLLYMPKDIVSGDFYWVNETKNKIFVAVVDCTGHGVPGAFMSIIGIELLRNITNVQGVNDSAEILNRLNTGVIQTFSKESNEEGAFVKDGMDVAFCVIDKENNILQYSGAFSNLYLVRDSKIIEVKGDRYSVGMGNKAEQQLFSSHYIPIHPDDMLYIFTDGYVDQFGGPENKKYKFRRFRHLLLNVHKLPIETQRQYVKDSIMEWKGDNEQVDDILIIGIKPDLSCLF